MIYEKPQKRNPHQITIRQHVFPRFCIQRFCDEAGVVSFFDKITGSIQSKTSKDISFCALRVWDEHAEHGYMKSIEDNFEVLSKYVLNGTKSFISGGAYSDAYLTMTRTGDEGPKGISAIIIESPSNGLSFGAFEEKMGWRAQPTAQVQFDDCRVPGKNLIGEEGKGFTYAMAGLDGGRLNIAASALGGAQFALNSALAYMSERKAFGKTLNKFQALQFKLADMEVKLQTARTFLRQAAWKLDTNARDASTFCAMAKLYVTDVSFDVANEALQLHGGYGYLTDYGIEKIVRDLRVHQILEGTNEIMRVIVSRQMLTE